MNKQYKHGHPGIGATGLQGVQGKSGNNSYIGAIDSFFIYVTQELLDEYNLSDYNITYSKDQKRLHPKYKPNDVLYILKNGNITKAIELTNDHILCTQEYLENSIYYDYPFALQYVDILHDNVLHFPLNMVYNNGANSEIPAYVLNEKYKHGLIKGLYYDSTKIIDTSYSIIDINKPYYNNIPILYDSSDIPEYYNVINNGDTYITHTCNSSLSHNLITCVSDKTKLNIAATLKNINLNTNSSFIKMNNVFVKQNNKGNVEALNVLFNQDLLLDVEGNAYTLNQTDYNIYTQKFQIDKSKFFKNIPENINDYHFGYIHTMYNSGKENDVYKPNYIYDVSYVRCTYRDVSKDADGVYDRAWETIQDITDESIKQLLTNTKDTVTLKDIVDKLPETTNPSIIELYKDRSGIIKTKEYTEDVLFNVTKTSDLTCEYYQTENENVSNFLLYTANNVSTAVSKNKFDPAVLEYFDPSYNSSIIYKIDPEDSYIELNHYDKNILPYVHHNIIQWIQYPNGFKYYSNDTIVTYNEYDNSYDISVSPQQYITDNITISNDNANSIFTYTVTAGVNTYQLNIGGLDNVESLIKDKINLYVNNLLIDKNDIIGLNNASSDIISYPNIKNSVVDISNFINNENILNDLYNNKSSNTLNVYNIPIMVEYYIEGNDEPLYDYYNINSTGYKEVRNIPKIDLHIYDDIESLEKFNNIDNGLLCNQFQFFIKVSISEFDKSNWGQYFDDLTLSFKIAENNVDKFTGNIIKKVTQLTDGVYTHTYQLVNKDVDIFNITAKELDSLDRLDISNTFEIQLSGDKEFYIRVLTEIDNPEGAILHFAYSVQNIKVKGFEYNASLDTTDVLYKSNHLYATVIPIALIAEHGYTSSILSYNGLKMYGSDDTLSVSIVPYGMDIAATKYKTNTELSVMKENPVNWNSYMLKNRYLQDNIEQIIISPININTLYEKLPEHMYKSSWLATDTDDIYNTYLQVCYDVTANTMLMNDEEIFYYNNNVYQASQYTQIPNNAAVFISTEIAKTVRTAEHINSLNIWNNEYKKLYYKDSDNPFLGHNSVYGNGYQYMLNSYDNNQYINDMVLPLADLKTVMDQNIFENNIYTETVKNNSTDNYTPEKLFASLLKQVKWTYPKYVTENGLSLIYPLEVTNGVIENTELSDSSMPYNLMYSIYPRILFNDETQMNIVLMLRKPTVKNETDVQLTDNNELIPPLNVLN